MNRFSIFLFVIFSLSSFSCGDECADISCENGGICVDGRCDCPTGFTGQRCEVKIDPCTQLQCVNADTCLVDNQGVARCMCKQGYEGIRCDSIWTSKYLGAFNVAEDCGSTSTFQVNIVTGPRFGEITIENFHNEAGTGGTAKVVAQSITSNTLYIPEQFMHFGRVEGSGSFGPGSSRFTLEYTVISNQDTLDCLAVFTR
ncbi:MAG: calcium-binding EGF-like domain-containing protein [Bacteroidia bacterium]